MQSIFQTSRRRVDAVSTEFHRSLYHSIRWDNRLIAIRGARGTGKTTMMLQRIKENFPDSAEALYASLDNLWFSTHSLAELVNYFYLHGGRHLFLDEVHKYPKWQTAIKNIYDDYPDLHIVYTGSSMLKIDRSQGDLSRRQRIYDLQGLSLREYLEFEVGLDTPVLTVEEICSNHISLARKITSEVKIFPYFERYLKSGYYPFYKESPDGYELQLREVVRQVIESDMMKIEDVEYATVLKAKKMLMVIAQSVPQTPKMSALYTQLETSREQGLKLLDMLSRGGLLRLLGYEPRNFKTMGKPDKILLENPNLMYALSPKVEIGTIRETFFANQLSYAGELLLDRNCDFKYDRSKVFEVGGAGKSFDQIAGIPDSYLAVDDTETGWGNRIPLWLFGFLY